jgi:hypothetical protein
MKISSNVINFAQGNTKLLEQFQDYWNHYRSTEGNTKVEFDKTVSFAEKEEKLNAALKKEIIRRSGVNYATETNVEQWFNHPLVTHEAFAIVSILVDMVLPESIIETIGLYSDVRVGGWGDSFAFDIEPRDLFVVSKAGKGQKVSEVKKQYRGQVTIIPEFRQVTVGVSLYRVLAGAESLAAFVAKAVRSVETQMTLDVYNAFATAMALLPSTTTTGLQVAGYTQASLVRICEQVTAWNQGAKAIVMGTALAVQNILPDDANYRYTLDDQYVKLGYIPTLSGYDIMRLPQVADLATPFGRAISDSYLWILSPANQKLVKLCLEGNTLSNTTGVFENANLRQSTTLPKSWGVGVATNAVAGVITL